MTRRSGKKKLEGLRLNEGPFYPIFLCANQSNGEQVEILSVRRNGFGKDEVLVHGKITTDGDEIKKALLEWSKTMATPDAWLKAIVDRNVDASIS